MTHTVVVTGGAGFIGKHVVNRLLERGYPIRVVDTEDALKRQQVDHRVELFPADLRDQGAAMAALASTDLCIALAARSSGIAFFNQHSAEMLDENTRIISNTFEAARRNSLKRLVYVSSSCAFDHSSSHLATEASLPKSPPPPTGYPFSKLIGEFYCRAYAQQFGLPYTIIRPFNVYGPGETPGQRWGDSHVIPDLTAKIIDGQYPLEIFGDGYQTRSFTHVHDIACGIVLAMESPQAVCEDFNLGFPHEVTILDLAHILWTLCQRDEPFQVKCSPTYPTDVRRRSVDISKARSILSWEPTVQLSDGLRQYIAWLRNNTVKSCE